MLAYRLAQTSSFRIASIKKCVPPKLNHNNLCETIFASASTSNQYFSKFSRQDAFDQPLLFTKRGISPLQSKKCLKLPPTNKPEFDAFLQAFQNELFKFNVSELKQTPKAHLLYGAGGLAPFILPPLQMLMFEYSDGMAWFQLAYAATILSYLGGIQWGATLPDSSKALPSFETLGLAVAPQLVAWFSLLLPIPLGLITTSTALTATLAIDLLKLNYPPWFKNLRIFLTLGAVGSLVGTLLGSIVA